MRIDELGADGFLTAIASVVEAVDDIKGTESAQAVVSDVKGWSGSIAGLPEDERNGKAGEFIVETALKRLPGLLRENGDAVYKILGAVDGQTAEEYKASFTTAKMLSDVKALAAYVGENMKDVASFLA